MKTVKNNFNLKALTLAVICSLVFNIVTLASDEKNQAGTADLQFVCKVKNLPVFRLLLDSEKVDEYIITVKDEFGEVLFSERLKGNYISRMYKLDTENSDMVSGTTFEVTSSKKTTVYKIKNLTKTVDDFYVTKL
jgi:glutamate synthase domain-containing protein 1